MMGVSKADGEGFVGIGLVVAEGIRLGDGVVKVADALGRDAKDLAKGIVAAAAVVVDVLGVAVAHGDVEVTVAHGNLFDGIRIRVVVEGRHRNPKELTVLADGVAVEAPLGDDAITDGVVEDLAEVRHVGRARRFEVRRVKEARRFKVVGKGDPPKPRVGKGRRVAHTTIRQVLDELIDIRPRVKLPRRHVDFPDDADGLHADVQKVAAAHETIDAQASRRKERRAAGIGIRIRRKRHDLL
mmetsp:Transcript_5837/g.15144  ORF Transcript_5837/g.15144 Transcript_5837/m.15144 type:complete len:241 (-) Transcript_5837:866-1588(-)